MMIVNQASQKLSHLQRMITPSSMTTFRMFAVHPQVIAPRSISALEEIGRENMALTKPGGLDYESIVRNCGKRIALKNKANTYRSFEDQINAQYSTLKASEATSRNTKRTGVLGYKIGMTHFWDNWGAIVPCSVIQLDRCQVTQVKTLENDGVNSMQLGIGEKAAHKLNKAQVGHFLKFNMPPKEHLAEFVVTPENFLPIGYCLGPRHFKIGQFVDLQATSIGKGTQGTIKRWNFAQQNMTHGNSKAHRKPGSIGHAEYPGKVFKGKKMAGRLGFTSATTLNQRVVKIDTERSLLYVMGNCPGPITGVVKVRDAIKKIEKQVFGMHYPTFVPGQTPAEFSDPMQTWEGMPQDPWTNDYHENDVVSGVDQDDD